MPLVRISLRRGKSTAVRHAIADGVHRALVKTMEVPEGDRFHVYRDNVANLGRDPGLRLQDVMIVPVENELPDWLFGNGEAQYLR